MPGITLPAYCVVPARKSRKRKCEYVYVDASCSAPSSVLAASSTPRRAVRPAFRNAVRPLPMSKGISSSRTRVEYSATSYCTRAALPLTPLSYVHEYCGRRSGFRPALLSGLFPSSVVVGVSNADDAFAYHVCPAASGTATPTIGLTALIVRVPESSRPSDRKLSRTWNVVRSARTPTVASTRLIVTSSRRYGPTLVTISRWSRVRAPCSIPGGAQFALGAAPLQFAQFFRASL